MGTAEADNTNQNNEKRYRHLFEHALLCIFIIDLTASPPTILEANRRAELVYGYPNAELVGMPADHLLAEEALPAALGMVQQVQQGQTVKTEASHRRRDGTRFPVRVIAAPDPTDSDQMIAMVEDITTQKQQRAEEVAIDADRRRIAHEIHDGVAQSLAGLRFKSALWADAAPPGMGAALEELLAVLKSAIDDLRRAIFALRPLDLEALCFVPALTQLVSDFGDQNQTAARLEVSGLPDALPAVYELPLFRIIQEGLHNVGQHARASSVLVRLAVDGGGGVILSLWDNGRGFDPQQPGPADHDSHFGLRQMRERIVDRGGTLDIRSASGQGTELLITLPPLDQDDSYGAD
jgi:PAS domain S-box-containing protein